MDLKFVTVNEVDQLELINFKQALSRALNMQIRLKGKDCLVDLQKDVIEACEKHLIEILSKKFKGNKSEVARRLGVTRVTLRAKLKKYNIEKVK